MIGTLLHDWFGWDAGAVLTNLVASVLWVLPTGFYVHRHWKCRDCWRPARVPVKGTIHHVCKKHATKHGHVH